MAGQGEDFGEQDDPDEFDYWHREATELAETGQKNLWSRMEFRCSKVYPI